VLNILDEIVKKRVLRIEREGYTLGFDIPARREVPLVPFIQDPLLICEIKRKSPSKGDIAARMDAVSQAEIYKAHGVKSLSILTEQDYFNGSLNDLMQVKKRFPQLAVLRKDFLLAIEDIDVSFRAGADAVLLIAAILEEDSLYALYAHAKKLGLQPLVEVHDFADIQKVRKLKPELTGINSRDLKRFTIDPALPLQVKRWIDWDTSLVYESGIRNIEDARFALSGGFRGLLVGEAVVRNPGLITQLQTAYTLKKVRFWEKLFSRQAPYVKVCGITNREDALHATQCGADLLGFIFAASPRKTEPALLAELSGLDVLKVAVVVAGERTPPGLPAEVQDLLDRGLIDAVQWHGDEAPTDCYTFGFPYYKALCLKNDDDVKLADHYLCPRVLIDAYSKTSRGGTGIQIPDVLVDKIREMHPLWIAGGIGPDNARQILKKFEPELIDASSKLESSPGKKDPGKVSAFIKEIKGE